MEVYLIPIRGDRYELYCEVADHHAEHDGQQGIVRRLTGRLKSALAEVEHRHKTEVRTRDGNWVRRIRDRMLRWMAAAIAEQRLLWHLRRPHEVTAFHPDDLPDTEAMTIVRDALKRDMKRHRRWFVVDLVGFVVSILLVPVPGPNLFFYYFAFRVVGHYLSVRGARNGLERVAWQTCASEALTDLRRAASLDKPQRQRRVEEAAARLNLQHLARFFERTGMQPGA